MHLTPSWQDASSGFRTVTIAAADHTPAGIEIRRRIALDRPAANDPGEPFLLRGQPTSVPVGITGKRLWLKSAATQLDVTISLSNMTAGPAYAPLDSPVFVGDPQAPTPAPGDNDTSLATTAFVQNAITSPVLWADYYVSPTGSDANTGLSAAAPFLTIQKAFDTIANSDHGDNSSITISLAAGTYPGSNRFPFGLGSKARIIIQGPAALLSTPTAIIDGTATPTTYGLWFEGASYVQLKDVLVRNFNGASGIGVLSSAYSDLACENVWLDTCVYGLQTRTHSILRFKYGKVSNCSFGILALDFAQVTIGDQASTVFDGSLPFLSTDGSWFFRNDTAIDAGENSQGHVDFCRIDGDGLVNSDGVMLEYGSRLNLNGTNFLNLTVGRRPRFGSWLSNDNGTDTTVTTPELFDLTSGDAEDAHLVRLVSYAKAALPSAATYLACMIYVSDETGGATPAFSDGTNWRRVADRAIVS